MKSVLLVFSLLTSSVAMGEGYIGVDHPTFTVNKKLQGEKFAMGLKVPHAFLQGKRTPEPRLYEGELPKKWDWREKGLTPIRNQGNCGSCWAFSGTATIADNLKLKGIPGYEDLSEQYRVGHDKTNGNGGCSGGWMHLTHAEGGSVLEVQCPYQANNSRCPAGYKLVVPVQKWGYVSSDDELPPVELLKRAIYTYGPLSVAVAVAGNFTAYSGGIYNEGSSGQINHAVNIVGWDDTVNPPHWIMRNSWGTNWGENGWMRIAYGSRKIGYGAVWVAVDGKPVTPDNPPTPPTPPCPPCPDCKPCPPPPPPVKVCPDTFMEKIGCFFR